MYGCTLQSLAFDIRSRTTVIIATVFVLWSLLVIYGKTEWFDVPTIMFFTDLEREGVFDLFMRTLTEIGDIFYMLGFSIILIIIRPTRKLGIALLILLVLTTLITGYVKCGVDRERPEPETSLLSCQIHVVDISKGFYELLLTWVYHLCKRPILSQHNSIYFMFDSSMIYN